MGFFHKITAQFVTHEMECEDFVTRLASEVRDVATAQANNSHSLTSSFVAFR